MLSVVTAGRAFGQWESDAWLERPVDDATFTSYLDFFAYDRELPFEIQVLSTADEEGMRREALTFASTPGVTVHADYFTASTASRNRPHVLLVHGGIRAGKASMRPIAEFLVRRGFTVLSIDMPYFGERDTGFLGSFSEADKHERLYNRESTYLQWVIQLVKDVGRSVDLLTDHYGADAARIAYVGFSRGAQAGFIVVAADGRFSASANLYGGHFDRSETGHLAAACPANYIGRIAPTPLWLLNGTFDGDYDRERSVEPLVRHAGEPFEMHWVETGHQFPRPEDLDAMADWLIEALK
ncbi:MAG: dienelactone hydrolase family protein [Gemmatimonadota bacterium]